MKRKITYSSGCKLLECPAKYDWRINKKLVSKTKNLNYIIGKAFHLGNEGKSFAGELLHISDMRKREMWEIKLNAMIELYIDKWGIHENSFNEIQFKIDLPCKIDTGKLIKIKQGRKWIERSIKNRVTKHDWTYEGVVDGVNITGGFLTKLIETKTTSEAIIENGHIIPNKLDKILLDWQTDFYAYALFKHGIKLDLIEYRFIKKPTIKLTKKETLNDYKNRVTLWYAENKDSVIASETLYTKDNYNNTEQSILYLCQLVEFYEARQWWPKDFKACSAWSGCQYLPLCTEAENAMDYFVIEEPHGELK